MLRRFAFLATSATQLYYDWKQSSRCRCKYLNCDQLSCWLEHLQDADWFFPRLGLEKLRAPWEEVFYPDFLAHLFIFSKTGGWYCQRSQQGAWGAWWRGNHNHQSRRRWQLQWCLWWRWQWWPMVEPQAARVDGGGGGGEEVQSSASISEKYFSQVKWYEWCFYWWYYKN